MATTLQLRRGTAVEAAAFTGADGELYVDVTNKKVYLHDGVTQGGHPVDTTLDEAVLTALIDAKQDALESGTSIKTINGSTLLGAGNIVLNGLPNTPEELKVGLYDLNNAVCLNSNFESDGTVLTCTYSCSIAAKRLTEDSMLHVFGKSVHGIGAYTLFSGETPPLTLNWNMPDWELDETFLAYALDYTSEVDNGNGTFTLIIDDAKASIPLEFINGVPTTWTKMNVNQLRQALSGNDITVDGTVNTPVLKVSDPGYVLDLINELSGIKTFSKNTTIMHLVAGSLGDFIQ